MASPVTSQHGYQYIVVGSGAGGGTVAARLAEAGHKVLLLEAGGDPCTLQGGDPVQPELNRLPYDYQVPVFHPFASENEAMKWDYFVRHYRDEQLQRSDPKYRETHNGVLYPRAATLGGCTAHNALILVYPHDADWDNVAALTGDLSWSAESMRAYFQLLENCHYRPLLRSLSRLGINPSRHGFSGWLHTEKAVPILSIRNYKLFRVIKDSALAAIQDIGDEWERANWLVKGHLDPNDWRTVRKNAFGVRYLPLTTYKHVRNGSRERVLDVAKRFPERLNIEFNALATRVVLDENRRAAGVEYLKGEYLYGISGKPAPTTGEPHQVLASREVILAGGAFNTPQVLMLSGIGPRDELERHGIEVKVDLPGVGSNLQDRYEVTVVNRMAEDWRVFRGAKFDSTDPQFKQWMSGRGPYITNGSVLTLFKRSFDDRPLPDLFCMALLGKFEGYYPGYSSVFAEDLNYLTWAVLKAHTNNCAGKITLRSSDPLDPPQIDFCYFQEGTPDGDQDLDSVVAGIKFVRRLTAHLSKTGLIAHEDSPGVAKQSDEELRDYVRTTAWGHHACGSCAIGSLHSGGVVSSDFRVHGVRGLRVVDASVFPRIPGFFIVSSVYMIGEKAADDILQDASNQFPLAPAARGGNRSGLVSKNPDHLLPYGIIFEEHLARRPDCLAKAAVDHLLRHPDTGSGGDGQHLTDSGKAIWESALRDRIADVAKKYDELEAYKQGPDISSSHIDALQKECSEREKPLKRVLHAMNASALCLSGGGIRSASFGLGVLEGLARFSVGARQPKKAEKAPESGTASTNSSSSDASASSAEPPGLLQDVDYLSTVSGGGYIGSWLTAWIYRRCREAARTEQDSLDKARSALAELSGSRWGKRSPELWQREKHAEREVELAESALRQTMRENLPVSYDEVIRILAGDFDATSGDPAARTVRHLREYTSYLAPSLGLSLDSWTLGAIYFRNLFINWLMLLPMLLAVVALPQFTYYVSLSIAAWVRCQHDLTWYALGLLLVLALFIIAANFARRNLPSNRKPGAASAKLGEVVGLFAFPVILANWVLLELWWSVSGSTITRRELFWSAVVIFGISFIGFLLLVMLGVFPKYTHRLRHSAHGYLVTGYRKVARGLYMASAAILSAALATALAALVGLYLFPALAQHNSVTEAARTGAAFCCQIPIASEPSNVAKDNDASTKGGVISFDKDQRLLMTFGLPVITFIPLLAVWLLSGFLGNFEMEDDREWWSRAGGIQMAIVGVWIVANAIALYSGNALRAIWVVLCGAALGAAGSALGFSGKTSAGPRPVKMAQRSKVGSFLDKYNLVLPGICGLALLLMTLGAAASEQALAGSICSHLPPGGDIFSGALATHLLILLGSVSLALLVNRAISVNIFSLNGLYRMRLIRAFMGASNLQRNPDKFTGFDPNDSPTLVDLPNTRGAPLQVVNTTLNLVGTRNTAWRQRKAEPFSFTALHCGSWRLGYVPTRYYAGADGPTLATAMTISGAAFNPNMGYHSSPLVTLLMTFFNVRLGWWLPNPSREAGAHFWNPSGNDFLRRSDPLLALQPLILEALGMTDDTYRWIELTDGGHFENLGLYEMVMRRCKRIIVVDAGADPDCQFEDLGNALRKIEIDLGIPIRFEDDFHMVAGPNATNRYCAVATIDYTCVDDDASLTEEQRKTLTGKLIYIKAVLTGSEPPDIKQYSVTHHDFPHETTANQFFNESQFESYRHLGSHEIETIVGQGSKSAKDKVSNTYGLSPFSEQLLRSDFETFVELAALYVK